MDAALDSILMPAGDDAAYDYAGMAQCVRELDTPDIPVAPDVIYVADFDPATNILEPTARARFCSEVIYPETHLFTSPQNTTNTMSGYATGIRFLESELINEVMPSDDVVLWVCNYGEVRHEGYRPPVVIKTNRGRRKVEKKKRPRKKQGNGTEFNSQITLHVRRRSAPGPDEHGQFIDNLPVYKFKVYRPGQIQLPGVDQSMIDDVIECAHIVVNEFNRVLHFGEQNVARLARLVHINPVMKDYKFAVKLNKWQLIDLRALQAALERVARYDRLLEKYDTPSSIPSPSDAPPHPPMFIIKYPKEEDEPKLLVRFLTPTAKDSTKKTCVKIFWRGPINILGALDSDITTMICDFLHWVFEVHDNIIVTSGEYSPPIPPPQDNVTEPDTACINRAECRHIGVPREFIDENGATVCDVTEAIQTLFNLTNSAFDEMQAEEMRLLDSLRI